MMKFNSVRKLLSVIGCIVLIAAMALSITGCGSKATTETTPQAEAATPVTTVLGEGSIVYTFIAVDLEGNESKYEIHTEESLVGSALIEHGLIDGEAGPYGLYVKTVNGITLDYDKDGKYWSLLIDGEYAMTGVDMTEAVAGSTYTMLPAE